MSGPDWLAANRANWDERVPLHLRAPMYDLSALRAGKGRLDPITEAELGPVAGLRVLHLQCHFGQDTLTLAQRGADATGLDFSAPAVAAARGLAAELGFGARFVQANLYDAPQAIPEPAAFDRVFVTWGALCWLPDIAGWARVVAHFLRPGGTLYLAEDHPAAAVFDEPASGPDGQPGWSVPYLGRAPILVDSPADYADPAARLHNARTVQFLHPLSDILNALLSAGLDLLWLHEHDRIPWQRFACLRPAGDGMFAWADRPWLPLSFSLQARRR